MISMTTAFCCVIGIVILCSMTCADNAGYTWWAPPHEYLKDHTIVEKDGRFHLFSICGTAGQDWLKPWRNNNEETFLHAVSGDLMTWQTSGYVLRTGDKGQPDHSKIWAPHIIEHNGTYFMFYTGVTHEDKEGFADHIETICLATSADLEHWTKHPTNPVLRAPAWAVGANPPIAARDPMVLRDDDNNRWIMYYTTFLQSDAGLKHAVGIATSTDLINWKDAGYAVTDDRNGATESPFVVKRDGKYYLFMNDRISTSIDPLKDWSKPKPYTAPPPGYAGEVVIYKGKHLRTVVGKDGNHFHITASEIVWQDDNCSFKPYKSEN